MNELFGLEAKLYFGYTGRVKTAISITDQEFALNEEAAARYAMNRSEFYTAAGRHYRRHLEASSEAKTEAINEAVTRVGQPLGQANHKHIDNTAEAVFETVEW